MSGAVLSGSLQVTLKQGLDEITFLTAQRDNLISHAEVTAVEKQALQLNFELLKEKLEEVRRVAA